MTQQSDRQASVRAITGTAGAYEGDWHALFDLAGIPAGHFNGRFLQWLQLKISPQLSEINGAMQAFAAANGAGNFSSLGTFAATTPGALLLETGDFLLTEAGDYILKES